MGCVECAVVEEEVAGEGFGICVFERVGLVGFCSMEWSI